MFGFLFDPNGRVSRRGIWLGLFLPQVGAGFVAGFVDGVMAAEALQEGQVAAPGLLTALVSLFFLWPNIAVPVKRFHDRGMSGWWVLWFMLLVVGGCVAALVGMASAAGSEAFDAAAMGVKTTVAPEFGVLPALGLLVVCGSAIVQFVILYFLPGEPGSNKFGPDPRSGAGGRVTSEGSGSSAWADRLADPAALSAAATAAQKASASAHKPAAAAALRPARQTAWPSSAGPRASFGRRGV